MTVRGRLARNCRSSRRRRRTSSRSFSVSIRKAAPPSATMPATATHAFGPRERKEENLILLAEAGTGLGKTLGYLAPAYLWARRNNAPVWVSTYTKNLQRQLDQETMRLLPDPDERRHRVVIRKGRENYLCLLNMQEAFGRMTAGSARNRASCRAHRALGACQPRRRHGRRRFSLLAAVALQRTESRRRRPQPLARHRSGLTDRRGECIYAACPHYRKCFIERAGRAARKADIVIANHALVLHQVAVDHALGVAKTDEEEAAPGGLRRLIFDEGHHLFDAADSAFSGHLTALETAELRRWLRGPEAQGRRGRGLAERIGDLISDSDTAERALEQILAAARNLPGPGWTRRIQAGMPDGPAEDFLSLVRQQVLARAEQNSGHSLETDCDASGRRSCRGRRHPRRSPHRSQAADAGARQGACEKAR